MDVTSFVLPRCMPSVSYMDRFDDRFSALEVSNVEASDFYSCALWPAFGTALDCF